MNKKINYELTNGSVIGFTIIDNKPYFMSNDSIMYQLDENNISILKDIIYKAEEYNDDISNLKKINDIRYEDLPEDIFPNDFTSILKYDSNAVTFTNTGYVIFFEGNDIVRKNWTVNQLKWFRYNKYCNKGFIFRF